MIGEAFRRAPIVTGAKARAGVRLVRHWLVNRQSISSASYMRGEMGAAIMIRWGRCWQSVACFRRRRFGILQSMPRDFQGSILR